MECESVPIDFIQANRQGKGPPDLSWQDQRGMAQSGEVGSLQVRVESGAFSVILMMTWYGLCNISKLLVLLNPSYSEIAVMCLAPRSPSDTVSKFLPPEK